jgi:LmbE family N-acetylglucosaminyl deacetylase
MAPEHKPASEVWDLHGWSSARKATIGRRQEDASALELLGAEQRWADLLDNPYRDPGDDLADFTAAVGTVLDDIEAERIAIPLAASPSIGFVTHGDHLLTRDGALAALKSRGFAEVHLFADLPYFLAIDSDIAASALGAMPIDEPVVTPEMARPPSVPLTFRLQIGIPRLEAPSTVRVKSLFRGGVEGAITTLSTREIASSPAWRGEWAA